MTVPLMLWDNTDDEWFSMLYFNGTWLLKILELEIHMARQNLIDSLLISGVAKLTLYCLWSFHAFTWIYKQNLGQKLANVICS